jgi:hypothetical protein
MNTDIRKIAFDKQLKARLGMRSAAEVISRVSRNGMVCAARILARVCAARVAWLEPDPRYQHACKPSTLFSGMPAMTPRGITGD